MSQRIFSNISYSLYNSLKCINVYNYITAQVHNTLFYSIWGFQNKNCSATSATAKKKNQAIGKQFFEGYGSYKRYIYCSDAVKISMSSDTNAIQDLLKIRIKSRDDGLTDQYNRIIMVKLLAILSLIMTAAWFEESISCMVPGTSFLRVLKFSVLKKPSKHKFTSRYTLENDM